MDNWKWLGHRQHYCAASRCEFSLATLLPSGMLVSTIGDYRNPLNNEIEKIGAGRTFETMVFRTTGKFQPCGCPVIENWNEVEGRGYMDAKEATEGHMAMCRKWEKEADNG